VLTGCRMQAQCAALRPDIQPLAGHGSDASDDYFAALVHALLRHWAQLTAVLHQQILCARCSIATAVAQDGARYLYTGSRARRYICMQDIEEEQCMTFQQLLDVFLGPAAPPDLSAAAAGCVAQRLGLLTERSARLRYSCPTPVTGATGGRDAITLGDKG
jgi:hypothetical protein